MNSFLQEQGSIWKLSGTVVVQIVPETATAILAWSSLVSVYATLKLGCSFYIYFLKTTWEETFREHSGINCLAEAFV